MFRKVRSSAAGASLDAHPADVTDSVNRIFFAVIRPASLGSHGLRTIGEL